MPIRPENKDRYPKDWPAISRRIRDRAGNKCEWCKIENGILGGRDPHTGKFYKALPLGDDGLRLQWPQPGDSGFCEGFGGTTLRIVRVVLTVAHLDHTPENCADDNLAALCQRCHNRYDAKMRREGILQRARAKVAVADMFQFESN